MAKTKQEIINEILGHMRLCGGNYRDWYVGISKDPRDRLFNGHCANRPIDSWIYRAASSSLAAREVEDYFVNRLGTDGGPGGGDHNSAFVYAYKKAIHTNP